MPVDATQVTELFCYGLPGPPQTFSAKAAALGRPPQSMMGVFGPAAMWLFAFVRWLYES